MKTFVGIVFRNIYPSVVKNVTKFKLEKQVENNAIRILFLVKINQNILQYLFLKCNILQYFTVYCVGNNIIPLPAENI